MERTISQQLAHFAANLKYEDIPAYAIDKVKTILLHDFSIAIASYGPAEDNLAIRVCNVAPRSEEKQATMLVYGEKTTIENAALCSSSLFHTRIQEDSYGIAHLGVVSIPLCVALAENLGKSGKELMTALVAGFEVGSSMAKDYFEKCTAQGFRSTPAFGIMAATTAAARLMDLTEEQLVNAYGFAHAFVCGPMAPQAGVEGIYTGAIPALNALWACRIAKAGGPGNPQCMEYPRGFFRLYCGTDPEPEKIVGHLGKEWEFMKIMCKAYPTDQLNQAHIINTIALLKEQTIDYKKIKSVTIEGAPHDVNDSPGIRYTGPFNNYIQASCSGVFSVCSILVHGNCTYASQGDFRNEEILNIVKNAKMVPNENLAFLCSHIIIEMEDGTVYERSLDITPDFFCPDLARETVSARALAEEMKISKEQLESLIHTISDLENEPDIHNLIAYSTVSE